MIQAYHLYLLYFLLICLIFLQVFILLKAKKKTTENEMNPSEILKKYLRDEERVYPENSARALLKLKSKKH